MAHTQTLAATLALLIFILLTLVLNEGVYSNTDLNVIVDEDFYSNSTLAPSDCRFGLSGNNLVTLEVSKFTLADDIARESLYGGFSARGGAISAIVLSIGAFVISIVVDDIDTEMDAAKYQKGSWFHSGDTKAYVAGVLSLLMMAGTALSMAITAFCTLAALMYQGYVPSSGLDFGVKDVDPREIPTVCSELDDNIIHRSDSLKASLFFAIASVFLVGIMGHFVRYDKKASSERE